MLILLRYVRVRVEVVPKVQLVVVANKPEVQVEHPLRKAVGGVALVEVRPVFAPGHTDISRRFQRFAGSIQRPHVRGLYQDIYDGLGPYALYGRTAHMVQLMAGREYSAKYPRLLLIPLCPAVLMFRKEYGEQFPELLNGHFT